MIHCKLTLPYRNFQFALKTVLCAQYDYGVSDFYNFGASGAFPFAGGTIFINNKVELTAKQNNTENERFSYYNKASICFGTPLMGSAYSPLRLAQFEAGNDSLLDFF